MQSSGEGIQKSGRFRQSLCTIFEAQFAQDDGHRAEVGETELEQVGAHKSREGQCPLRHKQGAAFHAQCERDHDEQASDDRRHRAGSRIGIHSRSVRCDMPYNEAERGAIASLGMEVPAAVVTAQLRALNPRAAIITAALFARERGHPVHGRQRRDRDRATGAAAALQLAQQRHFDLVIVNLDMPEINGWQLVDQLVALEPAIGSILLCSRDTSWQTHERADQAGCRGVLELPFDPAQIVEMLRKVV